MKRVAFITPPSAHSGRGIGFYASRLLPELKSQSEKFDIQIVSDQSHCDLIHYAYFDLFKSTLSISKLTPIVVTIHDVIPLEFPDHYPPGLTGRLNFELQKQALSRVSSVITDSFASVLTIRKYLKIPNSKIKLVYLAADPVFKKISRPKNIFHLPKRFVLYVGDINYNKNIPGLITACKAIDLPLVIVGKQALEIENLDLSHPELSHLKNLDLSNAIRLGFVSDADLCNIYNLASVYCQPSFSEGFGLPVLEALACNVPVACSNVSSLPELASNAATYFDPYNVDNMASALKAAHSGLGPAQAAKFSWSKTAEQTLLAYREII